MSHPIPQLDENAVARLRCPRTGARLVPSDGALVAVGADARYPATVYGYDFRAASELKLHERYIGALYSTISGVYDRATPRLLAVLGASEEALRNDILSRLGVHPGQTLLEVGVGTGSNMIALSRLGLRTENFGVDISRGMLRKCRLRLSQAGLDARLFRASASSLPFVDGSFDSVLCVGGFNSFPDKGRAIQEMLRVLRPGGRLVINDEGLSPAARQSLRSQLLVRAIFWAFSRIENCDYEVPLKLLPSGGINDLEVTFPGRGYFWTISLTRSRLE